MTLPLFLYITITWFLAGVLTGLTSFGANLFAIPLLTLVMPAQDAILLGCMSATAVYLSLGLLYCRAAHWAEICVLGLTSLLGVPLGVSFLNQAGPRLLLLGAGCCLVLFLLWQFLAAFLHRTEVPVSRWWCVPLGALSGVMMGAAGMGGPPFVIYAFLRHWSKESTICGTTLSSSFSLLALLPAQWAAGLYTAPLLKAALLGALFGILGIAASVYIIHKVNARLFRRLLLGMLALSAAMLLVRGCLA